MTTPIENERPILLIGAGGQLGGEFLKCFRHLRVPLVVTSSRADFQLQSQANGETQPHGGVEPSPRWRRLDVTGRDALLRLVDEIQPRVVINAAAYTAVDQAEDDGSAARAVNAIAVKNVAEICASHDAVLVHFSTDYVFDGRAGLAYTERDQPRPLNEYGLGKLRGEQAVLGIDAGHFVFRTSWLYTPGGRNFVTTMVRLFRGESPVRVVNDQFGCPTWARELATAVANWLVHTPTHELREKSGLYHLCSGGECSWYEFAAAIRERMIPPARAELVAIDSTRFGAAARRPARSVLDCSLAREVIKLSLSDWRDALDAAMPAFNDAARAGR